MEIPLTLLIDEWLDVAVVAPREESVELYPLQKQLIVLCLTSQLLPLSLHIDLLKE